MVSNNTTFVSNETVDAKARGKEGCSGISCNRTRALVQQADVIGIKVGAIQLFGLLTHICLFDNHNLVQIKHIAKDRDKGENKRRGWTDVIQKGICNGRQIDTLLKARPWDVETSKMQDGVNSGNDKRKKNVNVIREGRQDDRKNNNNVHGRLTVRCRYQP